MDDAAMAIRKLVINIFGIYTHKSGINGNPMDTICRISGIGDRSFV